MPPKFLMALNLKSRRISIIYTIPSQQGNFLFTLVESYKQTKISKRGQQSKDKSVQKHYTIIK